MSWDEHPSMGLCDIAMTRYMRDATGSQTYIFLPYAEDDRLQARLALSVFGLTP